MSTLAPEKDKRQTELERAYREELAERIACAIRVDGKLEPLRGVHIHRASTPTQPLHGVSEPSFCVIAQGSKEVWLGESVYRYDPAHYLLSTVDLPVTSQVVEASAEHPYLSFRMELDPGIVASVMVESAQLTARSGSDTRALDVSPLDAELLEATVRLARLLERPGEARILRPLITREIVFRLLMGRQGGRLRHLAQLGGPTDRIAEAVARLRREYNQPLRIESLARELGMSVSALHHHFKAITAMSPLQFQKQLRLQEARRLLMGEHLDAASAGYRVGYEDASQFNREYKRLFGEPPMRDVDRLRQGGNLVAAAQP